MGNYLELCICGSFRLRIADIACVLKLSDLTKLKVSCLIGFSLDSIQFKFTDCPPHHLFLVRNFSTDDHVRVYRLDWSNPQKEGNTSSTWWLVSSPKLLYSDEPVPWAFCAFGKRFLQQCLGCPEAGSSIHVHILVYVHENRI